MEENESHLNIIANSHVTINKTVTKTAPPIPPKPPRILALKRIPKNKNHGNSTKDNNISTTTGTSSTNNSTIPTVPKVDHGKESECSKEDGGEKNIITAVTTSPNLLPTQASSLPLNSKETMDKVNLSPLPIFGNTETTPSTISESETKNAIVKTMSHPSDLKSLSSGSSSSYEEIFFDAHQNYHSLQSENSSSQDMEVCASICLSGDSQVMKSSFSSSEYSSVDSSLSSKNTGHDSNNINTSGVSEMSESTTTVHCPGGGKNQAKDENKSSSVNTIDYELTKNRKATTIEKTTTSLTHKIHPYNGVIIKVPPSVIDTSNDCGHSECGNCVESIKEKNTTGNRVVDCNQQVEETSNEEKTRENHHNNEFKSVIQVSWPSSREKMEATTTSYENCSFYDEAGTQMRVVCGTSEEEEKPLVIHAVINLPPKQASNLQRRRRKTISSPTFSPSFYEKSSKLSEAMAAEYQLNGDMKKKSTTIVNKLATKLVRSGSVSDCNNKKESEDDKKGGERRASTSSLVLGSFSQMIPEKTKKEFSRSSSFVQRRVKTVGKKMGSWYVKRVKNPVADQWEATDHGRALRRLSFFPFPSSSSDMDEKDSGLGNRSRRNSSDANNSEVDNVYATVSPIDSDADQESQGQNEFDELRKVVKQGADFCKDLASVLQERSELEGSYAKGLSKLSGKLLKASKEATGSVAHAWQAVAVQIETQAELHRQWSTALLDEISKPLKSSTDTQHKIRKSVEVLVDKTTRNLAEWRTAEAKAKRQCFSSGKEFEKLQESAANLVVGNNNQSNHTGSLQSVNNGTSVILDNGKTKSRLLSVPPGDKDPIKMEAKRRKAEEAVRRADIEYYTFCVRSERARLEWEGAIRNGSTCLRTLEEEKLSLLRDLALKYCTYMNDFAPKMVQSAETLNEPVKTCNVEQDLTALVGIRRQCGTEQLLPDFYAEDNSNLIRKERRKEALQKFLCLIEQDLEREKKSAIGVESLAKAVAGSPQIDTANHDIADKLYYMKSMLLYLEGSRCKVDNALCDLEGRARRNYKIMQYMRHQRDKEGLPQTILKIPSWTRDECLPSFNEKAPQPSTESAGSSSPDWTDRGNADGNSHKQDSDFDEFSSEGSEHNIEVFNEDTKAVNLNAVPSIGRCRAIYDYDANMFDELTIRIGDILNIHDKQEDGWWLGEMNGMVGIFPATYVEEIE